MKTHRTRIKYFGLRFAHHQYKRILVDTLFCWAQFLALTVTRFAYLASRGLNSVYPTDKFLVTLANYTAKQHGCANHCR